jgi:uncharacterized protein (UPF0332 family)
MATKKRLGARSTMILYRLGATVPDGIRLLLDAHRINEQEFARADVVSVWQKARDAARDASLNELSVDSAIRLAYNAGHLAALALLAVRGLKPCSGQGHHEMALHAAAALGGESLDDLVADSEELRGLRKGSMYDPAIAGEAERTLAIKWIRRTLPLIRTALVTSHSALDALLAKF